MTESSGFEFLLAAFAGTLVVDLADLASYFDTAAMRYLMPTVVRCCRELECLIENLAFHRIVPQAGA